MEGKIPRKLRYFVAKLGEKYVDAHPVEGGCYPLPRKFWPSGFFPNNTDPTEGDVALLYCFKNYLEHSDEIPGLGLVYSIDEGDDTKTLWYHFVPFASPIDSDTIRMKLTLTSVLGDLHDILDVGRTPYRLLFEIQNACAYALLKDVKVNWP